MGFPESLGPFGAAPLSAEALPSVHRGRQDGGPQPSEALSESRYGWYSLDTSYSADRVTLTIRNWTKPPALAFTGVKVSMITNQSALVGFYAQTPGNERKSTSSRVSGASRGSRTSSRSASSIPHPNRTPASPRNETGPRGRVGSPQLQPVLARLGATTPKSPEGQSLNRALVDLPVPIAAMSPRGRGFGLPISSPRHELFGRQQTSTVMASLSDAQDLLPGMRVLTVDDKEVRTEQQLLEFIEQAGPTFVITAQDDDTAPLIALQRGEYNGFGPLSPASPVTLPLQDRRAALIPEQAVQYMLAYPIEVLEAVPESVSQEINTDDPLGAFAVYGGFLYLDAEAQVVGANALAAGDMLHFDGPFPWRQEYTQQLEADGRLVPITLHALREKGATHFAYLMPNEVLGGFKGLAPWKVSKHGGFVYMMQGGDESLRSTPRRGSASSQIAADGSKDFFFVMLGGADAMPGDTWEQLRVCPHCQTQQREDLSQEEVKGAMRCDNCGQLSALIQHTDLDKQDLIRASVQLLGYFLLLLLYIFMGAWVLRTVELPHEEDAMEAASQHFERLMTETARNISSSPGMSADHVRQLLVQMMHGIDSNVGKCTPDSKMNWDDFGDSLFHVFTMVITIPEVLPQSLIGRIFFVFYVAGGLVCVLNVIFDLANVIPHIIKELLRLAMMTRRKSAGAKKAQSSDAAQTDLFALVDWDGSGTLGFRELVEFMCLYEGTDAFDADVARELMIKVDDGTGQLNREGVRKATVLWERMKEEAQSVPGSYMVVASILGNVTWILVCAALYGTTDGLRFDEALWLCFLTLTTVGFGPRQPSSRRGQVVTYFFFLVGLGSLAWLFAAIGSKGKAKLMKCWHEVVRGQNSKIPCMRQKREIKWWQPAQPPVRFFVPNDQYGLLSPVYPTELLINDVIWPSVLHFIVSERFRDTRHEKRLRNADNMKNLDQLQQLISGIPPRQDWEAVRDDVMLTAMCNRITQSKDARDLLIGTGERTLIYDISEAPQETILAFELRHWGSGSEGGNNRLGELLHLIRTDIKRGRKTDLRPGVCNAQPIHFFGYLNPQYAVFTPSFPAAFLDEAGTRWPTVDHYFQAQKFVSQDHRQTIRNARTPHEALQLGRERDVVGGILPDWEDQRCKVMFNAQVLKFAQNPRARQILLQTGNRALLFADESDSFWGSKQQLDGQPGANMLGHMLEQIRDKLRTGVSPKQMLQDSEKKQEVWFGLQPDVKKPSAAEAKRKRSRLSRLSRLSTVPGLPGAPTSSTDDFSLSPEPPVTIGASLAPPAPVFASADHSASSARSKSPSLTGAGAGSRCGPQPRIPS
eukprot:TRINITY_DN20784_c0_g1_i1.p1 TRINITY_DN20784_c0_g1~~TRINITY_DN20784_c0_g1_i1.p1  ORF type:complete len:1344 (+),score=278.87 TRINITY_DN20784_c0_g1_i1:67-4032(+)